MKIEKPDILIIIGTIFSLVSIYKTLSASFENQSIWFYLGMAGWFLTWWGIGLGTSDFLTALRSYNKTIRDFGENIKNDV